jgi:hypothetical protein
MCTYPLAFFSLRASTLALLFPLGETKQQQELLLPVESVVSSSDNNTVNNKNGQEEEAGCRRVLVSVVLIAITAGVGFAVHDVELVLGFTGSVFASLIVYVYPCLMLIALHKERPKCSWRWLPHYALIAFGLSQLVLGVVMNATHLA